MTRFNSQKKHISKLTFHKLLVSIKKDNINSDIFAKFQRKKSKRTKVAPAPKKEGEEEEAPKSARGLLSKSKSMIDRE